MKKEKTSIFIHIAFILFGAACVIPFIMIISASFSSEMNLSKYGFMVLPKEVDFTAYAYLFENPKQIIDGYKMTIFITAVGTFLSVIVMSMVSYALARENCKFRGVLTWYLFFPTLFSGGMGANLIRTVFRHHLQLVL